MLSVQWEPRAVAVAFIYLAAKLNKHDLQSKYGSKSRSWWRQFVDTLDSHDLDSKRNCVCVCVSKAWLAIIMTPELTYVDLRLVYNNYDVLAYVRRLSVNKRWIRTWSVRT